MQLFLSLCILLFVCFFYFKGNFIYFLYTVLRAWYFPSYLPTTPTSMVSSFLILIFCNGMLFNLNVCKLYLLLNKDSHCGRKATVRQESERLKAIIAFHMVQYIPIHCIFCTLHITTNQEKHICHLQNCFFFCKQSPVASIILQKIGFHSFFFLWLSSGLLCKHSLFATPLMDIGIYSTS